MRINRTLALIIGAVVIGLLSVVLLFAIDQVSPKSSEPASEDIGIPLLTHLEIRDPKIAPKYGIVGYLEITVEPNASKSLSINQGKSANITLLFRFVSHVPNITETLVNIDPNSGRGLTIEQVYSITDEKGNVTGKDTVNINKLISYNPGGNITIKANQTLPVILNIRIPGDFPSISFPLNAVGVTADVPILDDTRVMVFT